MDLFFRLIWVATNALFSPKTANIFEGTRLTIKILWLDRIRGGQLKPSRIPSYCDLAIINFFIKTGTLSAIRAKRWTPVILGYDIHYHDEVRVIDAFEVTTSVTGWQEQFVNLNHKFRSEGQLIVEVNAMARMLAGRSGQVTGTDILEALQQEDANLSLSEVFRDQIKEHLYLKSDPRAQEK